MGLFDAFGEVMSRGIAVGMEASLEAQELEMEIARAELEEERLAKLEERREKRKLKNAIELEKLKHKHALELLKAKEAISRDFSSNKNTSSHTTGKEYELFCGNLLQEAGWNVKMTSENNDQGVDLVAAIEDIKVCIQCKRYSNPVGNKAVQEIIAGTIFYDGTHSVVVSSSGFTKSAIKLAKSAGVILLNDSDLEDLEQYL